MSPHEDADPIVVTGIGLVTPVADDREATWQAVCAGRTAGRWLDDADLGTSTMPGAGRWFGNPVAGFVPENPAGRASDRVLQWGLQAAREAWDDARVADVDRHRIGCVFGTSKGSLHAASRLLTDSAVDPALWPISWPSAAAAALAQALDIRGICLAPVAACATGMVAILRAWAALTYDDCDLVIAGSADDSLHPAVLASFQRLGVLARGACPASASRPFDRQRTGFVVGAGAGALILERRSHAARRGVMAYAELRRGRLASDPTGLTQLDGSGATLARLLQAVIPPGGVPDLVQLHGTGTRLNDPAECRALHQALGGRVAKTACYSAKGALGHLLGAAGSVEVGLACLSLRDQLIPPTANLTDPDPACAAPLVQGAPMVRPVRSVLKVSLGFGGHQAALWLTAPS